MHQTYTPVLQAMRNKNKQQHNMSQHQQAMREQ